MQEKNESVDLQMNTRNVGRPPSRKPVTKASVERRMKRIEKYISAVKDWESPPLFAKSVRPPTQAISITLSLRTLIYLDLYVLYAEKKRGTSERVHHGIILDDAIPNTILKDEDFQRWLQCEYPESFASENKFIQNVAQKHR